MSGSTLNNHDITFQVELDSERGSYTRDFGTFFLTVQRGVQVGGLIDTNTTWTADKEYLVTSSVIVSSGITLTIEPGTTIRFDQDTFLSVNGALYAVGSPTAPIVFTSNGTNQQRYWRGIFLSGSKSYLRFTVLEYAGRNAYAALNLGGSSHEITKISFRYNNSDTRAINCRVCCLKYCSTISSKTSGISFWRYIQEIVMSSTTILSISYIPMAYDVG